MVTRFSGEAAAPAILMPPKVRAILKGFFTLKPAQRKAALMELDPKHRNAVTAYISYVIALQKRQRAGERLHGGYDGLLMGFKPRTKMGKEIQKLIRDLKAMSPAQRKAYFKKIPAWKKLLIIAAAPALLAAGAALAVASLPVAISTAIPVAATFLTAKGTRAVAKKIRASVIAAREKRIAAGVTSGPEAEAAQKAETAASAAADAMEAQPAAEPAAEPAKGKMPAWLVPAAGIGALLMFL